jgi:hypothetical protein
LLTEENITRDQETDEIKNIFIAPHKYHLRADGKSFRCTSKDKNCVGSLEVREVDGELRAREMNKHKCDADKKLDKTAERRANAM